MYSVKGLTLDMTDKDVKRKLCPIFNGVHAKTVCKNCGTFIVTIDGDIDTVQILSECENCETINNKTEEISKRRSKKLK